MLQPDHFTTFPAALRRAFPDMSQEKAEAITAAIGDRPVVLDGKIEGIALGEPFSIPLSLWEDGDE